MTITSLETRAFRGASWFVVEHILSQSFRVINNALLLHLIIQQSLGVVGLANVVMMGLTILSNLGIGLCIIQDERGNEPEFLKTAWTMQIILGIMMWGCTCLIAYPYGVFYSNPIFWWLLPLIGLNFMIGGFNSTALFTYYRELRFGKPIAISLISQVMFSIVTIGFGLLSPSIWCLVLGGLAQTLTKMLLSHGWLEGIHHTFCWNREMVNRLLWFGRWILGSSVILSVFSHIEKLAVKMSMLQTDFFVYESATSMILMVTGVALTVTFRVNTFLLSLYANLKGLPSSTFQAKVRKIKLFIIAVAVLFLVALIFVAPGFAHYYIWVDPGSTSYSAGVRQWFQILALGIAIVGVTQIGPIFLAFGDSFLDMKLNAIKTVLTVICLAVGGWKLGVLGLLWGRAIANLLYYPFVAHAYRRYSIWFPRLDFIGLISVFGVAGLGWYLNHAFVSSWSGT